jgi:hypothetical protein
LVTKNFETFLCLVSNNFKNERKAQNVDTENEN